MSGSPKLSNPVGLIIGSAVLCAFTFKIPVWTGIKISREWPIATAVLFMIVWMIIHRREGFRTVILIASALGIGIGLLAAKVIRSVDLGSFPTSKTLVFSLLMIAPLAVLLVYAQRKERQVSDEIAKLDKEYEEIMQLPRDEAIKLMQQRFKNLESEFRDYEVKSAKFTKLSSWLIGFAMVLVAATLPLAFRPSPKPLLIVLDIFILALGVGFFVLQWSVRRATASGDEEI